MYNLFSVDISENALLEALKEETFNILLRDHSRKQHAGKKGTIPDAECDRYHIIWATPDYEKLGKGFREKDMIMAPNILGKKHIIVPRSVKDAATQRLRTQDKAEVFTPSWVCNMQNNLVDEAWFGRKDVFNTVSEDGKSWTATKEKITFPEGKTWVDYISEPRLEITCGEAPYLVSRYDTTSGDAIPIDQRIGLFDRKMRVIHENCGDDYQTWVDATRKALQSCYGFEWHGDNLLLARENMIVSAIEYYQQHFNTNELPPLYPNSKRDPMNSFAYIISWNLWQMDGLKCVIPMSCHEEVTTDLFGGETRIECQGCKEGGYLKHNGIPCYIRNWPKMGDHGTGKIELFTKSLPQPKTK